MNEVSLRYGVQCYVDRKLSNCMSLFMELVLPVSAGMCSGRKRSHLISKK